MRGWKLEVMNGSIVELSHLHSYAMKSEEEKC